MHCLCCRLKWFNIQGNAIGGGVPSNWSVMGNLTRLNLASNKLQGISAHRGSLKCIKRRAACFSGFRHDVLMPGQVAAGIGATLLYPCVSMSPDGSTKLCRLAARGSTPQAV